MSLIWIVNILSVFFLCVFFAGIVIPQILLIAFRRRLFDEPDERKIHQCVVPRLGGMAFKPVVFFSFVLLLAVNVSTGHDELLKEIGAEALPLAYAFCAIIMLYLVGIADDLIGVRYRAKFFIQIVCGIMLVAGGVELSDLHGMLFIHSMPSWISIPLTVFRYGFHHQCHQPHRRHRRTGLWAVQHCLPVLRDDLHLVPPVSLCHACLRYFGRTHTILLLQGNIYRNRTNYHSKFQAEGCRRIVGVSF